MLAVLNSHKSNKPSDDFSVQKICSFCSVKTAVGLSRRKSSFDGFQDLSSVFEQSLYGKEQKLLRVVFN